jgi:cytoskeletal protein RodZ
MGMNDFDNLEFEDLDSEETISTSRGSNRTFLIVAGILGGILLIALLAIAAYAIVYLPGRDTARQTQDAAIYATNTAVAEEAQLTAIAKQVTNTPTFTATLPPTNTPTRTPTKTSTPVLAPTNTPDESELTPESATETVSALLTQQAGGGAGTPVPTATALPATGFADDFGVPGLLLIAGVLMVVIILSRRLRTTST